MSRTANKPPVSRTPATDMDRRAANSLTGCVFMPGTYEKWFAQDMLSGLQAADWQLTDKQRLLLYRLCHRFRGQIRDKQMLIVAAAFNDLPREGAE